MYFSQYIRRLGRIKNVGAHFLERREGTEWKAKAIRDTHVNFILSSRVLLCCCRTWSYPSHLLNSLTHSIHFYPFSWCWWSSMLCVVVCIVVRIIVQISFSLFCADLRCILNTGYAAALVASRFSSTVISSSLAPTYSFRMYRSFLWAERMLCHCLLTLLAGVWWCCYFFIIDRWE